METIELNEAIRLFIQIGSGDGAGYGDGYGSGYGAGYGAGYGSGHGNGSGYGDGDGSGYGDGYGSGYGDGDGDGYGSGSGSGDGYGAGSGDGAGYGDGYGSGYGYGSRIKAIIIQGHIYYGYLIDNVYTFVESVDLQRRILAGFILNSDLTTTKCVVVKEGNTFAHGKDLHEAYEALREKLYDDSTEDERLAAFIEHYPDFEGKYPNGELFIWHHILTGSCLFGRKEFAKNHNIDLDGSMSILEFISLTENAYNGGIIRRLKEKY